METLPPPIKFSIVTVSFNQAKFLEEALCSVLQQDYREIEYIVVDPGSTDGSRQIIEHYAPRLAHVVFEPDQGAAEGLNKGFARATGEIFGFLNSDDVLLPGAIRAVSDFFLQHPGCDIVMGAGMMVDTRGVPIRHIRPGGFDVRRYFYGGATWLQQSTFFRRQAFEAIGGFNVMNRSCWDGELMLEMVANGASVQYLDRDLSLFRVHPASITGSNRHDRMMKADIERMFQHVYGRRWNRTDSLQWRMNRIRRLLTHKGALESAVRGRLNRGRLGAGLK